MQQAALYISKKSALRDGIRHAQARGVSTDTILAKTKVKPVYSRGCLQGYRVAYPINETSVKTLLEA
jgi:hypothetical protein